MEHSSVVGRSEHGGVSMEESIDLGAVVVAAFVHPNVSVSIRGAPQSASRATNQPLSSLVWRHQKHNRTQTKRRRIGLQNQGSSCWHLEVSGHRPTRFRRIATEC